MSYDLTGEKISFTYGRVVQVVSGSYYDGFGNPLPIGTSSIVLTGSVNGFATTGSNTFIGNQTISGSVVVTNGITGSLFGTSSYSLNSISSSYAVTASYAITASYAEVAATSISSQNSQDILLYVKNTSGAIIPKGKVVRIVGVDNSGNVATIELADFRNENNSANTLGFTNESFGINAFGYVMTEGYLLSVDTGNFSSADLLYLSSSGNYTNVSPRPPNHGVRLGQVIRSQQNNGTIYVRIDNGAELDELHNVYDTSTTSSYGDLLIRSGSVWTNSKNLTGSYTLSGSLTTNDGIIANSVTASFYGTSSWSNNVISSSYALTASYALNGGNSGGTSLITGSTYSITSSWANNVVSSSYALSASYSPTNTDITSSWSINSVSASYYGGNVISSSYASTASYVTLAQSASYYNGSVVSSSYSLSSSYAPIDTNITASWSLNSLTASYVTTSQTASYYGGSVTSASYAISSSYAPTNTNITASWSINSLTASNATLSQTASYVVNAQSSSYYGGSVTSASYSVTASYAPTNNNLTASYAILASVSMSLNFVDDAAAAAGGVPLGGLYRNGNFILIRLT